MTIQTSGEIDQQKMRLIVGLIAIGLACVTNYFSSVSSKQNAVLESISESYYHPYWAQSIFVGCLFAIAVFLLVYNGESSHKALETYIRQNDEKKFFKRCEVWLRKLEKVFSRIGAIAAIGIALFPCACDNLSDKCTYVDRVPYVWFKGDYKIYAANADIANQCIYINKLPENLNHHFSYVGHIHNASAAILFIILLMFCLIFLVRAQIKGYPKAAFRSYIYAICAILLFFSMLAIVFQKLFHAQIPNIVYWGEMVGLVAFGVSWLVASKIFPFLTNDDEKLRLRDL